MSCRDILVCLARGSEFEPRIRDLFPQGKIGVKHNWTDAVEGLSNGTCSVIAGSCDDIVTWNVRKNGYLGDYAVGINRFSKAPRTMAVRQDDHQWAQFVFWVVSSVFFAEEQGINITSANEMPANPLFGRSFFNVFRDVIHGVGSYAEIFRRNLQGEVSRGGPNLLNFLLTGPQHYPLPHFN